MENEVFDKFTKLADGKNKAQTWDAIKVTLIQFNVIHEDSAGTDHFSAYPSKKIDILNVRLNEFGYRFVGMDGKEKDLDLYNKLNGSYDSRAGELNRNDFLRYNKDVNGHKKGDIFDKNDKNFKGTILP
jgi:hypothetical protein